MSQHKAAVFPAMGKPAELIDVKTVSPGEGEVLVRNHAVAINPLDYKIRDLGLFVRSWPVCIGEDTAGEVTEVGRGVKSVKKGDRVLVATTWLTNGKPEYAGFQEYTVVPEIAVSSIPDSMSYADACVIPVSATASAAGLFQQDALGLDLPSTQPKPNSKKILIWGASSSVAGSGIQLAVAAGYEVITTASSSALTMRNSLVHPKCSTTKVRAWWVTSLPNCSKVNARVHLMVSQAYPAHDSSEKSLLTACTPAIGDADTQLAIATILAQLGGGKIATVMPPPEEGMPATVTSKQLFGPSIFLPGNQEVGEGVFKKFLPAALKSGQFVPFPKAEIVGTGLDAIEGGLGRHQAGVSATKIVVTL